MELSAISPDLPKFLYRHLGHIAVADAESHVLVKQRGGRNMSFKIDKSGKIIEGNTTVGYLDNNKIMDRSRSTLGYFEKDKIMDRSRSTVGYVDNSGKIMNKNRGTAGKVGDVPLKSDMPLADVALAAVRHFFIKPIV